MPKKGMKKGTKKGTTTKRKKKGYKGTKKRS